MELRHLRYFTAVVECKGYREASRRLHIAKPSISEAVSDLEDELGLKLFSRTHRNARLTPEGEIFYADAVRILQRRRLPSSLPSGQPKAKLGGFRSGLSVRQRSLSCLTSFADTNWSIRMSSSRSIISILSNWTRHMTEARSISPSRAPSRLSTARIDNREYCCVTPWLRSSLDRES